MSWKLICSLRLTRPSRRMQNDWMLFSWRTDAQSIRRVVLAVALPHQWEYTRRSRTTLNLNVRRSKSSQQRALLCDSTTYNLLIKTESNSLVELDCTLQCAELSDVLNSIANFNLHLLISGNYRLIKCSGIYLLSIQLNI